MKIGVFDSGLGGLVITKAFIDALPQYDYLYLGDTAHLPYGEKTSGRILKYTLDAMRWLIKQDCKLIIIACNTATSICLRYIQQKFIPSEAPDVKVLGVIIPTVEVALSGGEKNIGVIATRATVESHIYQTELQKLKSDIIVQEQATPKIVPLIEENDFSNMEKILEGYLQPLKGVESLILGCTHYPLIKNYARKILPNGHIISQDEFMGAKLTDYLRRHPEIETKLSKNQKRRFVVSQINPKAQAIAERLIPAIKLEQTALLF